MVGVVLINFLCFVVVRVFCRPTEEQIVRLKIHHGGMFIYKSSTVYVNSEIVEEEWGWRCHFKEMSQEQAHHHRKQWIRA